MEDELKDTSESNPPATAPQDDDEAWDWVLAAGVSREDLRKALYPPVAR